MAIIYVLDEHPLIVAALEQHLNQLGHTVFTYTKLTKLMSDLTSAPAQPQPPHLIIMGLVYSCEHRCTFEHIDRIMALAPTSKLAVLICQMEPRQIAKAIHLGVQGYICKSESIENILIAIDKMLNNHLYYSHEVHQLLHTASLTPREMEVLQLVSAYQTNDQIATALNLSEPAVRNYINTLYKKANICKKSHKAKREALINWFHIHKNTYNKYMTI